MPGPFDSPYDPLEKKTVRVGFIVDHGRLSMYEVGPGDVSVRTSDITHTEWVRYQEHVRVESQWQERMRALRAEAKERGGRRG